jgi:hypothetical protein
MAKREKDTWEKSPEEYTFNEVVNWVVGKVIFGLASGQSIHDIIYMCMISLANTGKLKI